MAEITYMDCWHFIAPLIPVKVDTYSMDVYVMTFQALKEAEERKKGEGKQWLSISISKLHWMRSWLNIQMRIIPNGTRLKLRRWLPPMLHR